MSLAAELAELDNARVEASGGRRAPLKIAVLEREWQFGYHTTGRSAAAFLESYGSPEIRALTRASRTLIDAIGASSGTALLRARPLIWVVRKEQLDLLDALVDGGPHLRRVDFAAAQTLCPA